MRTEECTPKGLTNLDEISRIDPSYVAFDSIVFRLYVLTNQLRHFHTRVNLIPLLQWHLLLITRGCPTDSTANCRSLLTRPSSKIADNVKDVQHLVLSSKWRNRQPPIGVLTWFLCASSIWNRDISEHWGALWGQGYSMEIIVIQDRCLLAEDQRNFALSWTIFHHLDLLPNVNNYPPKWRWIVVNICWAAKRRGK